jgi:hypothetical protein
MDRREFLGASAGLALTPSLVLGGSPEQPKEKPFGFDKSKAFVYVNTYEKGKPNQELIYSCTLSMTKSKKLYKMEISNFRKYGGDYELMDLLDPGEEKKVYVTVSASNFIGRFADPYLFGYLSEYTADESKTGIKILIYCKTLVASSDNLDDESFWSLNDGLNCWINERL